MSRRCVGRGIQAHLSADSRQQEHQAAWSHSASDASAAHSAASLARLAKQHGQQTAGFFCDSREGAAAACSWPEPRRRQQQDSRVESGGTDGVIAHLPKLMHAGVQVIKLKEEKDRAAARQTKREGRTAVPEGRLTAPKAL